MGADLYSAGLLVRHELSESVVAVPHGEAEKVLRSEFDATKLQNSETVQDPPDAAEDPAQTLQDALVHLAKDHNHHHHHHSLNLATEIGTDYNFQRKIVWFNAIGFLALHLVALYGIFLMISGKAKLLTTIYCKKTTSE